MPGPETTQTGRILLDEGKLVLGRLLGKGGMGAVYEAKQTALDRKVAVKVLLADGPGDPNWLDRARRLSDEARAASRITHANLVRVFGAGEDERLGPYVVYEILEGGTLRDALDGRGPFTWKETVERIAAGLLGALGALHEAGIVHRDVKPENLFLTAEGPVKLGDFGLAVFEGRNAKTATGTFVGTPGYIAPERIMNPGRPLSPAADVYAAAVLLVEAATGRLPFSGKSVAEIIKAQVGGSPSRRTLIEMGLPESAAPCLAKALNSDPDARSISAATLFGSLGDTLALDETAPAALGTNSAKRGAPTVDLAPPRRGGATVDGRDAIPLARTLPPTAEAERSARPPKRHLRSRHAPLLIAVCAAALMVAFVLATRSSEHQARPAWIDLVTAKKDPLPATVLPAVVKTLTAKADEGTAASLNAAMKTLSTTHVLYPFLELKRALARKSGRKARARALDSARERYHRFLREKPQAAESSHLRLDLYLLTESAMQIDGAPRRGTPDALRASKSATESLTLRSILPLRATAGRRGKIHLFAMDGLHILAGLKRPTSSLERTVLEAQLRFLGHALSTPLFEPLSGVVLGRLAAAAEPTRIKLFLEASKSVRKMKRETRIKELRRIGREAVDTGLKLESLKDESKTRNPMGVSVLWKHEVRERDRLLRRLYGGWWMLHAGDYLEDGRTQALFTEVSILLYKTLHRTPNSPFLRKAPKEPTSLTGERLLLRCLLSLRQQTRRLVALGSQAPLALRAHVNHGVWEWIHRARKIPRRRDGLAAVVRPLADYLRPIADQAALAATIEGRLAQVGDHQEKARNLARPHAVAALETLEGHKADGWSESEMEALILPSMLLLGNLHRDVGQDDLLVPRIFRAVDAALRHPRPVILARRLAALWRHAMVARARIGRKRGDRRAWETLIAEVQAARRRPVLARHGMSFEKLHASLRKVEKRIPFPIDSR